MFRLVKKILFGSWLLIIAVVSHAQSTYTTTWYSADSNHLPQNSVKSISQDRYGFIWLATEGGLVRYDGENFKVFNAAVITGLASDRMYYFGGSVKKDSITVRNELGELIMISGRGAVKLPLKGRNRLRGIDSHLETIHGLYYTEPGRNFRLRAGDDTYTLADSIVTVQKGTQSYSFRYKYEPGSRFFALGTHLYRALPDGSYICFDGRKSHRSAFPVPPHKDFKIYLNMAMQQVFLVSGANLYMLREQGSRLSMQLLYTGFDQRNNILAVYYDKANALLYLGSSNKGLLTVQQQPFSQIASTEKHVSGTDGVFYALSAFQGKVLASTGDLFDEGHFRGRLGIGKFSDKYMMAQDHSGDLWLKAFTDLYRATKASGYAEASRWRMPDRITAIAKGRDGMIWTGVSNENGRENTGLLYRSDPARGSGSPQLYCKLPDRPVVFYFADRLTLWVGGRQGLYRLNLASGGITAIKGFEGVYVRDIVPDGRHLWVTSYNHGLLLYRDGKAIRFPLDKNRYLQTAHCVMEDRSGFMWITTNSGLFRVSKKDLYAYAGGTRDNVFYYRYTKSYGFSTNEFNGGCAPCGVYLNNRTMFFPSMDGIVYFNPKSIRTAMPVSDIFIDDIQVDNRHFRANDSITLDRNFGRIRFYITSPFYGDRYNQNIEVKLEGPVSQNWLPLSESNVSFSTLPPGHYTFIARKMTGFGSKWKYKEFVFYIKPAFWQTWWFTLIIVAAGALAIMGVVRMRINYIRYRNRLLENQVAEQTSQLHATISTLRRTENDLKRQVDNHRSLIKTITHDIKSPLRFMSITGRFVYTEIDKNPAAVKEDVESIYTASSQLYHFVDNFLEYSKAVDGGLADTPFVLEPLVAEKLDFFKAIAKSRNVILVNKVPGDFRLLQNRHLVAIVLHNLLDNALKHTTSGYVTVSAALSEGNACVTVTDTGAGMSEGDLAVYRKVVNEPDAPLSQGSGLGLHIIAELLAIMDATIEIESEEGGGTVVTVCFKGYSL